MAKWALVENNIVILHRDQLPENWRNHSGLNLSENNLEFLNSLGWYEIEVEEIDYDSTRYRVSGHTFSFNGIKVIAHSQLQEIVPQELQNIDSPSVDPIRHEIVDTMRHERNIRLLESDWTMFPDVIEKHDQEWYEKWKIYRQTLRDLPQMYPEGAYVWPEVPR